LTVERTVVRYARGRRSRRAFGGSASTPSVTSLHYDRIDHHGIIARMMESDDGLAGRGCQKAKTLRGARRDIRRHERGIEEVNGPRRNARKGIVLPGPHRLQRKGQLLTGRHPERFPAARDLAGGSRVGAAGCTDEPQAGEDEARTDTTGNRNYEHLRCLLGLTAQETFLGDAQERPRCTRGSRAKRASGGPV
jgi:hypothetical protein